MRYRVVAVLMSVLMASTAFVKAEQLPIGYVDLDKVFSSPVVSEAFNSLKTDFEKRHKDFQDAQQELQSLMSAHEKEAPLMTKTLKESREVELRDKANKLSQRGSELTQEYYGQQQQLKHKYLTQVESVCEKLAHKYKLQMIHIKNALIYVDPMFDLTDELISEIK